MLLKELLADLSLNLPAIDIKGIQLDSRKIQPGDLFIALNGTKTQGEYYIQQALEKGAVAVLQENPLSSDQSSNMIFHVPHLSQQVGHIAARFFDHPSHDMVVIGITGTNGKTSTCCLIAQALAQLGYKVGVIGTLGIGQLNDLHSSGMTTPDAITVQKHFSEFKKAGINAVVMEVSSHALDQGRVNGLHFNVAVFTNLTRDHLDYHLTMENYAAAKRRLFDWPGLKAAVINMDDETGRGWLASLPSSLQVCAYSLYVTQEKPASDYLFTSQLQIDMTGIHADLESSWGQGQLTSGLLGPFNCSNLLAVLGTLCILGVDLKQALAVIQGCQGVPGRMQLVRRDHGPLAVIDYAHTPDALEQVLKTLKTVKCRRIFCVFGCGGDRDRGKRPLMAQIAEKYADQIFITSDNPRSENPGQIIDDMLKGLNDPSKATIEIDRALAIQKALHAAEEGDIVLVAGKGHETTQTIGTVVHDFSDVKVVEAFI